MKPITASQKLLLFLYAAALIVFCHHFIVRPIILDWGSPAFIRNMKLAGDDFTNGNSHTRAVLIRATPEQIWPWLLQMGQDRGGMYSYEMLENIVGADMKNVYKIVPEFQLPRLKGDTIWLANKNHYKGQGYQIIAEITPNRSYVMVGGRDYNKIASGDYANGSWAFYLYPENENTTWLIARSSEGKIGFVNKLLRYVAYEVPHFIMERKMLVTMKTLIENTNRNKIKTELVKIPDLWKP
jgi:hypothetical protein